MNSALEHVDRIITPTRFAKEIQIQRGLRGCIVNLPNFAPAVELADLASPGDPLLGQPYFLFVGRLEKIKGLQTLIPAFHNYNASLLIAGTGSYETHLRRLAAGDPNIRFLGHVDQATLQSLYRRAIAVIVPSLCYESFPLVMLEAYRQQTPTMVRNLGGMPEVSEESGGGIIYDTQDDLVAAMDRLVAEPSTRMEMGLRGYRTLQQKWTAESHLERYFALIREVADSRALSLD